MSHQRLVLLAAAILFLWWLGGHDLWAPDEPYFAEGAREMLVDGHWAVPHVNGVVTTDKPPLFFWLIALFSLPGGAVTPLTARLPSVLAALGTVLLVMRLGRRWRGPRTAALAGLILTTTFMFWDKARWSQTDSVLCFLIWAALSAFEAYRAGDADGRRAGLLFWLAMALATLDKGPVGLLLPLGIALVVLAADRRLGRWRGFAPLLGPLLFVAVAAAWITWTVLGGPAEYSVWGALREHFVDRGLHGMHHEQPFWYFLERLPTSLLPWSGLVPAGVVLAWRRRDAGDRFALAAALFVVVFFSISTEKRELYALPAVPALALLMAAAVAVVSGWKERAAADATPLDRRWVTVGLGVVGGLLALVAAALPWAAERVEEIPMAALLTLALPLAAAGVAAVVLAWRRRVVPSLLSLAAGMSVLYLVAVTLVYPAMEPRKSARPFSLRLAEATAASRAAGLPVMTYRLGNLPEHFAFHTGGLYTLETDDAVLLAEHLSRPEMLFAAVHGEALDLLPRSLVDRLYLVEETRLARRDVLLVANFPHSGWQPLADHRPGD